MKNLIQKIQIAVAIINMFIALLKENREELKELFNAIKKLKDAKKENEKPVS